jgi:hypothetical protein
MSEVSSPSLSAVVYRSTAVKSFSPPELQDLTDASQRRNGRENITGLLLYNDDRFFQWLEGPPDSVGRVMESIRNDRRHKDVEVLDSQSLPARRFADWHLKLATTGPVGDKLKRQIIEPPRDIVDELRVRPQEAPALLVKLVPGQSEPAADPMANMPLTRKTAAILKSVFLAAVVPQLVGAAAPSAHAPPPNPRAAELADLLVANDQHAALDLIREMHEAGESLGPLSATLLEPAARRLGDLWSEDFCSEFDVTLGLCRLQMAVRLLSPSLNEPQASRKKLPVVLIAPEPGELHRLGAALDGSILRNAGWAPHTEYPSDDNALDDLLSASWFDVLDLSLSAAFRRDQSLPQLAKTIADARHASKNPALVVVVGGRVFLEEKAAGAAVGADHANTTAFNVNRSILRTLSASLTEDSSASETVQLVATPS